MQYINHYESPLGGILLAADGQEIVWVVGYRISERYRVREDAEKIIQLEVSGGYTNE